MRWWDFLFYATFGIVVTNSIGLRLVYGWAFGLVGSAMGMIFSFWLDTPPGATIVYTFGAMLLLFAALRSLGIRRPR